MRSQGLKDYVFYLLLIILYPVALHLWDDTVPMMTLFHGTLLLALVMPALKGLTVLFPIGDLKDCSLQRIAGHARIQGLLIAAFMVLFRGLDPDVPPDLAQELLRFVRVTLFWGGLQCLASLYSRKLRRSRDRLQET
jgi:hypothetical protein